MQHSQIPFRARSEGGFRILAHWHNEIEILYVTKGKYSIGVNDECKEIIEGEFVIVCSDDIHYFDATVASTHIILIIRPDLIGTLGGWPKDVRFETPFITSDILKKMPPATVDRAYAILETLPVELEKKDPQYENYIRGLLFELTSLMLRHLPTVPIKNKVRNRQISNTRTLQTILEFLESNYTNDINLEDIAKLLHISPFHLARVFRGITGMNFKTFINNFRIEKADHLLQNTTDSITKIAFSCGFGSVRTFNRVYKSNKGHPPSK